MTIDPRRCDFCREAMSDRYTDYLDSHGGQCTCPPEIRKIYFTEEGRKLRMESLKELFPGITFLEDFKITQ